MDWFSALLGTLLLRTTVGGATLLGMFYLWHGYYALGVAISLPLLCVLAWLTLDIRSLDSENLVR